MRQDMLLVVDMGSTRNTDVARAIRALGVYSEICNYDVTAEEIAKMPNVKGIVANGGPNDVVDGQKIGLSDEIKNCGLPVFTFDYEDNGTVHPMPEEDEAIQEDLRSFIFDTCKAQANWNMENFIADQIELIRKQVGDKKVLLALSGGVDSSVAAVLLSKAVGEQLTCVFVDHGLLRKNEGDEVEAVFGPNGNYDLHFIRVNAQERFYSKLAGVTEPERKRKIIGEEFIRVFEEEAKKIGKVDFLAQGTIYPDVVESGLGGESAVIKSHHNVGGLPEHVDFKDIVEPLRNLFKDEVRKVGLELGLPDYLVFRQPFPGPGLGIRIIGEVTAEKVRIVQDADWIYRSEVEKAAKEYKEANGEEPSWMPNQYFAALTNMRSVGVMGDERTYDYAVAVRAVRTVDFMTAEAAEIPFEVLQTVMSRIINEVKGVNRVFYDLTSKPPGTIEFE